MAKAANSQKLQDAFEEHLAQTKEHVARLEQVLSVLGKDNNGEKCAAMAGLIKEGKKMIDEDADPSVKDAGLIACAQRVEHYEIAGYGVARTFAQLLGHSQAAELLQSTLDEEKETDCRLTELAESEINVEAQHSAS